MSSNTKRRRVGAADFEQAELGNRLRTKRLVQITETLCSAPAQSFPQLMDSAELEGYYRFVNSEHVEAQAIVRAHAQATAVRIAESGVALAIHDTSEVSYSGQGTREGLEQLGADSQGLRGHFTLAVSAEGEVRPLGVLSVETWTRVGKTKLTKAQTKLKKNQLRADKESARWWRGVQTAEERAAGSSLIHVMDQEGDSYELFARHVENRRRFLIRSGHCPREVQEEDCLEGPTEELREALERSTDYADIEVSISKRLPSRIPGNRKKHPPRAARRARLRLSAMRLSVLRPKRSPHLRDLPEQISLNVVLVREVDPPKDEEPIEWLLATSEPIETVEQVRRIVDWYRARWLIEEFFRALKTGCALEKRQHETRAAIEVAMAISLPVACQLLDLRNLARRCPDEPASRVLTPTQIEVLRSCSRKRLSSHPTIRECFLAIAADGGHIARNGEPGWITLARGFDRLRYATTVWEAARKGARKPDR